MDNQRIDITPEWIAQQRAAVLKALNMQPCAHRAGLRSRLFGAVLPAALDALEASMAREAEKDAKIEEQAKRIKFLEDHILRITPAYKKSRDKLLYECDRLTAERDAEKRRADAAVAHIQHGCYNCANNHGNRVCVSRRDYNTGCTWVWDRGRGQCAENTEAPTVDGEREESE